MPAMRNGVVWRGVLMENVTMIVELPTTGYHRSEEELMSYCNSCGSLSSDNFCASCVATFERIAMYLQVLDLEPGASEQQIKQAFRELAKVWHPDRFDGDQRMKQRAHEKFSTITVAYHALSEQQQMVHFLEIYVRSLNRHGQT